MELLKCFIFLTTLTVVVPQTEIPPILNLHDNAGTTFQLPQSMADMTGYTGFFNFLPSADRVCTRGMWMFYGSLNYAANISNAGIIYGPANQATWDAQCYVLTPEYRAALATMKSFRSLVPTDLNRISLTLFAGEYYTGARTPSYTTFPQPSLASAKSYIITRSTAASPPVSPNFRVYWASNYAKTPYNVCLNMARTETVVTSVLYASPVLNPIPILGGTVNLTFGSITVFATDGVTPIVSPDEDALCGLNNADPVEEATPPGPDPGYLPPYTVPPN